MMAARTPGSLIALAEASGIAVAYEDARKKPQTIAPETLIAVLGRLGVAAETEAERQESLARRRAEAEAASLPPLVTAEAGAPVPLPARLDGTRYVIDLEGCGRVEGVVAGSAIAGVAASGYHELIVGGERATLAVAPEAGFWPEPRAAGWPWGIAAQIYALRRKGDGGIGDFTAVGDLAEAAAHAGADALAISPVHAMFAADPGRASPYSPSNRLVVNGLLADPAGVLGEERVRAAAAALGQAEARAALEAAELIDWEVAGQAKLALMRRLFDELDPETRSRFEAWRAQASATVEDHAVFEVLHDLQRGADGRLQHWRDWGADYAAPDASGVARLRSERAADVGFHVFLQWLAETGLEAAQARARGAGMTIGLIADLAVGADGGGSQAWASREDVLGGLHIGAPPDIYNALGQDWGLVALDPLALRRSGFRPFLQMLRASLAWAGGVRIDHILGLHRIWVIPEGAPPTEGAYLHFPREDLLRLVALESARSRAVAIGEDLGTVPGGLREELARRRILGMSVLWFEQEKGRFLPPAKWRKDSVAMTTTHDLPTVAGWWAGRDLDWRDRLDLHPSPEAAREARSTREQERRALWKALVGSGAARGAEPPPTAAAAPVEAALAHVGATACRLALAPMEDLAGEVEQPNLPGTIDAHPNWRRRLPEAARRCEGEGLRRRLDAFRKGRTGK